MPKLKPSCKTCEYVIDPEINPSSYIGCQLGVYPFPILKSIDLTQLSCKGYRLVGNIFCGKEKCEAVLEAG